jgi:hypothetical protein
VAASKFTDETRLALLELRRDGATLEEACQQVRVSTKTMKGWLTKGRHELASERDPEYFDFACAWAAATGAAEAEAAKPMTRDEVIEHLEKMVRAGNIRAIETWLKEHPRQGDDDSDAMSGLDALDAEDELAQRREQRGA